MATDDKNKRDAHSIAAKIPTDLFFRLIDHCAKHARMTGKTISHAEVVRLALEAYLQPEA